MDTLSFAKKLRKNQTECEYILWQYLRNKKLNGVKFKRQFPIGPYIVDFISYKDSLIIELDGGHHNEEVIKAYDEQRSEFLESLGYRVIRFWDSDVKSNVEEVLEIILENLVTSP